MTPPDAQPPEVDGGYGGDWPDRKAAVMARAELTPVDFLLARLAEDEVVARGAMGGRFTLTCPDELVGNDALAALGWVEHAKRFNPARVLAEVEAKRRIVAEHGPEHKWCGGDVYLDPNSPWCDTLRILAAVHKDHPDWREEWSTRA